MTLSIKMWSQVDPAKLEALFQSNPFPLYRGTPLGNPSMKTYMYGLARENAEKNDEQALVALVDDEARFTAQLYQIPYLSDFWGMSIGGIGHMVTDKPVDEETHDAAVAVISRLLTGARSQGMRFLSTSVPGPAIPVIRALERSGFLYAEGFINMVGPTHGFRETFTVPDLKIREITEADFAHIDEAYSQVNFPSRFVTDGGFDPKKAHKLYGRRFREVHEKGLGKIFVADYRDEFAGALIAIIDEKLAEATGIRTNILSGMGIIIHPRAARRGVSLSLIHI